MEEKFQPAGSFYEIEARLQAKNREASSRSLKTSKEKQKASGPSTEKQDDDSDDYEKSERSDGEWLDDGVEDNNVTGSKTLVVANGDVDLQCEKLFDLLSDRPIVSASQLSSSPKPQCPPPAVHLSPIDWNSCFDHLE